MARSARQTTLARPVTKEGIGLHSGAPAAVTLAPAEADSGIVIATESGGEIPANADWVVSTERATTLGRDHAEARGVEHLLAALWAMSVDNARIVLRGPETPACDGSARPWAELIARAGRRRLAAPRTVHRIAEPVWVTGKGSWAAALPAERLALAVAVEYPGSAAGAQAVWLELTGARFAAELAPARTFCLEREYQALLASGLAKGGGAENAFVVKEDGYSGELRFPDEVVRHKALDLVGDLSLCGFRFVGQVIAVRPSHHLNVRLASALRERRSAGSRK